MKRSFGRTIFVSLALVLGLGSAALAQPESSGWHEIRIIQVKPDMVGEWRELQKNGINPALKKAGVPYRAAWRSVLGNSYEWQLVTPITTFSQYDQVSGIQISEELSQKLSRCIVGREVHASLIQRDLSKSLSAPPVPPVNIATTFRLVPGTESEYRELAKSYILPAMHRINAAAYEVYPSVIGGPDQWRTVRLADSVAELDKGPALRRGLDEKTYELVAQKLSAIQMDVERTIRILDTELSFFPESSSNENE